MDDASREIWKDIPGFENKYQVSRSGKVRSLSYMRTGKVKELKQANCIGGYKRVQFVGGSGKIHAYFVHVLVARVFVPGELQGMEVNHLDFNPSNNQADNLEWVTHSANIMHSHRAGRRKIPYQGKVVCQYSLEGKFIKEYPSANEAARETGAFETNIISCCRHKQKTAAGYKWEYGGVEMENESLQLVITEPQENEWIRHIRWNYDEFKELVRAAMERYEGVTFTEEQVKEAKEERARLNALKKVVSDQRIRVKNAVMAPYAQFEAEVREITELIDKPIAEIDRQVREFEDAQKADKKEALRQHFEKAVADMEFRPTFEQVFDPRYLNVSVSLAKAKKDIAEKVKRFRFNMENVIEGVDEEHRPIVRDTYLKTLDIALAMSEQNRLKELKRQEEERKAREAERRTAEAQEAAIRTAHENAGTAPNTPARPNATESSRKVQPDAQIPTQTTEGNDVSRPAQNPFVNPPKEKRYKASFTVVGSMNQILAVKKFMVENGIHFEKGVK